MSAVAEAAKRAGANRVFGLAAVRTMRIDMEFKDQESVFQALAAFSTARTRARLMKFCAAAAGRVLMNSLKIYRAKRSFYSEIRRPNCWKRD